MAKITIFDTTLRDGEQSPGCTMTPAEKLRMAHQLEELGVDVIEAGFPIASDTDFNAVRTIAREVREPVIAALARATGGDIDRAGHAVEGARRSRIHTFIATSDIHLERKLGIGREECLEQAAAAVERACGFTDDVEFSAEDATRTELGFLCDVINAAVEAGATTINIPDTVGYTFPAEFRDSLRRLVNEVPGLGDEVVLSVHCHDDLGTGGGQQPGRPRRGRAPGRVHHQRHRRAGGQRVARGDRDGAQGARGHQRALHRGERREALSRPAAC